MRRTRWSRPRYRTRSSSSASRTYGVARDRIAFDCSGLVMMAYRAAGITIPRTSEPQWTWGPRIQPGHEEPGDLVFFAGSDGTPTSPGHVAMVLGKGMMIEAEETGVPIHIVSYKDRGPIIGFTRPWAHAGVVFPG